MASKPRAHVILGMELLPSGRCFGTIDAEGKVQTPCNWTKGSSYETRQAAKVHATNHPGHVVRVTVSKFDDYKAE
jgi:hypothetical protein